MHALKDLDIRSSSCDEQIKRFFLCLFFRHKSIIFLKYNFALNNLD
jgi:hypothetical protein